MGVSTPFRKSNGCAGGSAVSFVVGAGTAVLRFNSNGVILLSASSRSEVVPTAMPPFDGRT
jgi:hypothetical protein